MDTTTLLIVILVLLLLFGGLVWPRALVLTNSCSPNAKPNVVCRLARAHHRVSRCGVAKCPAGGVMYLALLAIWVLLFAGRYDF